MVVLLPVLPLAELPDEAVDVDAADVVEALFSPDAALPLSVVVDADVVLDSLFSDFSVLSPLLLFSEPSPLGGFILSE